MNQGGQPRRYKLLDVFTEVPLEGNPLAVFEDGTGLKANQMQAIARELNLSETVFLLPPQAGGDARLRIFTPAVELPFAGHPVLGASLVVAAHLESSSLALETAAGKVAVRVDSTEGDRVFGWMEQPIPQLSAYERPEELLAALGLSSCELPVDCYENGPRHVCVALASKDEVAGLRPDMGALATHERVGVSCFAGAGNSYKTRMFAPALGVPEDPATGSAAGPVCWHLARYGRIGFGETVELRQGEEVGRPSRLVAKASGSLEVLDSLEVGGGAVLIGQGELTAI